MTIEMALRRRITELKNERGISICKWCLTSGVSPTSIYDLMKNRTEVLKISTIKQLCIGINITLSEFFSPEYFNDYE